MTTPKNEPLWNLYTFDEPQQIVVDTVNGEPVYFDCCDCGEVDAVLAGYMATRQDAGLADMAYRYGANGKYRCPAFFCQKCWTKLLTENPE
ncbi:MAG: hypothetical protein ACYC0X_21850 [Pirellulaceae bacterium]